MFDKELNIYVGGKIKLRRLEMCLKQSVLAKKLGITYGQMINYESGRSRITCSVLFEISKILCVPISYFFEGFKEESLKKYNKKRIYNKEIVRVIDYFKLIKDKNIKHDIINLLKDLGDK